MGQTPVGGKALEREGAERRGLEKWRSAEVGMYSKKALWLKGDRPQFRHRKKKKLKSGAGRGKEKVIRLGVPRVE